MEVMSNTYVKLDRSKDLTESNKTALRMMLYMAMASITMFFALTTSALLLKKADVLNWAQFPLPMPFYTSTIFAILSSVFFYTTFKLYKDKKFFAYKLMLLLSGIVSLGFLVFQLLGFKSLIDMGFPLTGNVSGSFIYFLAIVHGLHIIVGIVILLVVFVKSYLARNNMEFEGAGKVNPRRVLGLELLTAYWHFINVLWLYLFLFFYFNYQ